MPSDVQFPLDFTQRQPDGARVARDRASAPHQRDIERLIPVAQELARKAGRSGLIMASLRMVAVQRGYLTGAEQGRALSWLGAVMKAAGLRATGLFRRSHIARSRGIPQVVWVDPEFYDEGLHGRAEAAS